MADEESLRASLHRGFSGSLSSASSSDRLSVPSPLEACFKAPPQAELERLLGFSLNPESYEWLRRGEPKPLSEPKAPAASVETPAPKSALALPVGVPVHAEAAKEVTIHSQALAACEDDTEAPEEGNDGCHVSPKKTAPDPLSPGSPES